MSYLPVGAHKRRNLRRRLTKETCGRESMAMSPFPCMYRVCDPLFAVVAYPLTAIPYLMADVQITADNVPVIYHDLLVKESGMNMPLQRLTYVCRQRPHVALLYPLPGLKCVF